MINTAEVYLWGTRIGILHLEEDKPYAAFEYDKDFIGSGIELSPLRMPLSARIYEFPDLTDDAFHGVPGLIADSLPDRFGNAVISKWLASRGKTDADFNVIDRLCYTGSRGMGALEYVPAIGPSPKADKHVNVSEMVRLASAVLSDREHLPMNAADDPAYSQLLQLGTSAGGARAKAVISWNESTGEIRSGQTDVGESFAYWLMKFDGVSGNGDHDLKDPPEYTKIEYAYYQMALIAGIDMNECRLYSENGRHHFMTRRFDRTDEGRLHMQTLGALTHISYNDPGLCSYELAASCMRQLGLPASDVEQFFRRMVFNVLAVNQDDHVKNTSFLMDRSGRWCLAPAYDITYSFDPANRWLSAHQMSVNGKRQDLTYEDLLASGKQMDISPRKIRRILDDVCSAVDRWPDIAHQAGIREKTISAIRKKIEQTGEPVRR